MDAGVGGESVSKTFITSDRYIDSDRAEGADAGRVVSVEGEGEGAPAAAEAESEAGAG